MLPSRGRLEGGHWSAAVLTGAASVSHYTQSTTKNLARSSDGSHAEGGAATKKHPTEARRRRGQKKKHLHAPDVT